MSDPNLPPAFLLPAAAGVRSRRHQVVLCRAEAHLEEATSILQGMINQDSPDTEDEQNDTMHKKALLVWQAIEELEWYVNRHPRSSIGDRLENLKEKLLLLHKMVLGIDE